MIQRFNEALEEEYNVHIASDYGNMQFLCVTTVPKEMFLINAHSNDEKLRVMLVVNQLAIYKIFGIYNVFGIATNTVKSLQDLYFFKIHGYKFISISSLVA